jgi:hypothetical protein
MITQSSAIEKANARAERFAEETRRISEITGKEVSVVNDHSILHHRGGQCQGREVR